MNKAENVMNKLERGLISTYQFTFRYVIEKIIDFIRRKRYIVYNIAVYILLLEFAYVFLYPFLYLLITAMKSPTDLLDMTVRWIPREIYWENFKVAFAGLNYWTYFQKSLLVTLLCVLGHIISCSLVAYGFARCRFPGRNALFMIVMLTIIVPAQVIIVPLFMQYSTYGWLNTYLPLIVPTFFGMGLRGGLFIFLFRQFFIGLPTELEDSARIDGCSTFRIFWNIVLPISKTAILVCTVLGTVWHWNDYYEPAVYLTRPKNWLLPMNLTNMYATLRMIEGEEFGISEVDQLNQMYNTATLMAGTLLVILPLIIMYLFLQRRFMESIERTGLVG